MNPTVPHPPGMAENSTLIGAWVGDPSASLCLLAGFTLRGSFCAERREVVTFRHDLLAAPSKEFFVSAEVVFCPLKRLEWVGRFI
ncbi:MAG: hypothetical protein JWR26_2584 [Pedosphaera sp.]|nr:hypothetical protein [Pedosphaera sp.]